LKLDPLTVEQTDSFDALLRAATDISDAPQSDPTVQTLAEGAILGNGRFSIRRLIGRGGMGAVYEAEDRELVTRVALKVLNSVEPQAISRFKDEFRALADTVHPHLVRLRDLFMERGVWFFTMDLIEGSTLSDHLAAVGPVGSAERERELLRLLPELVDGVAAIHATGHLHRDLKPANVLVTREGRVVIVDFGLIGAFSSSGSHDRPPRVVGTASYMAPEQARGEPATEASDWYALGTIAYEAFAGRMPIDGDSTEVLVRKRRADLPRLFTDGGAWPKQLVELCLKLLLPNAEDRLDRAGILRCLGISESVPSLRGTEPAFVGRVTDLAVLDEALDRAQRGALVVSRLSGPPGIGKTALVREFIERAARERNALVLSGRCYEREATPFKLLEGLVDSLFDSIERRVPRARSTLSPLSSLFLGLSPAGSEPGLAPITAEPEIRSRAVHAFRKGLTELGALGTVILHIDDVHWSDLDGVGLLEEVLEAPAPPVLLILTQRDEEVTGALLALDRARFLTEAVVLDLHLEGLSNADVGAIARAVAGGDLSLDTDALARESGGSPYFVTEIVRHALDQRRAGTSVELAAAATLGSTILSRSRSLPAAPRRILEALSVSDGPSSVPLLEAATGIHDVARAIAVLKSASFVRTRRLRDELSVEPYHDRVREEINRALSDSDRRALHGGFLRAFEVLAPHAWESMLHHSEGAGDLEKAAICAMRSAERAALAQAHERAAALYRRALGLRTWDAFDERKLCERLGEALAACGHSTDASEAYERAARAASGTDRVRLQLLAASLLLCSGNIASGFDRLTESIGYVGVEIPEESELFHRTAACGHQALVEAAGLVFRDEPSIDPDQLLRIDACWWASAGLNVIHHPAGPFLTSVHFLEAVRAGEPSRIAYGAYYQATISSGPQWDALAPIVQTLMEIGDRALARAPSAILRFWREYSLAWQSHFAFDLDRTAAHVEAASKHATALGDGAWPASAMLSRLEMFVLNARLEKRTALGRAAVYRRDAQRRGDRITEAWMTVYDGEWWMTDKPEDVRAHLNRLLAEPSKIGGAHQVLVMSIESILAWVERYLGLFTDASTRMERVVDRARGGPWWMVPRARVHLSGEYVASAIARAEASGRPLPGDAEAVLADFPVQVRGLADVYRAGIANLAGDRSEAIRLLERAEADPGTDRARLVALGARFGRGRLLGSVRGDALVRETFATGREIGGKNPERLLASLWPGFGRIDGQWLSMSRTPK
jgi:eukaryotic-like serine/threonine-protein kinase